MVHIEGVWIENFQKVDGFEGSGRFVVSGYSSGLRTISMEHQHPLQFSE